MPDTTNKKWISQFITNNGFNLTLQDRLELALQILGVEYANTAVDGEQVIYTGLKFDEENNTIVKFTKE